MKLSEQVEKVLSEIENIQVPQTLSPWESGRGVFQTGGFINDTKTSMKDIVKFVKTQNSLK